MPDTKIIKKKISLSELKQIAKEPFGDMVKAVVDVERNIMAVGGSMHADEEALMLERGSEQKDLWGINIYPDMPQEERVEFDSMINIRPSQGNKTRGVEDAAVRERIIETVNKLIG